MKLQNAFECIMESKREFFVSVINTPACNLQVHNVHVSYNLSVVQ